MGLEMERTAYEQKPTLVWYSRKKFSENDNVMQAPGDFTVIKNTGARTNISTLDIISGNN